MPGLRGLTSCSARQASSGSRVGSAPAAMAWSNRQLKIQVRIRRRRGCRSCVAACRAGIRGCAACCRSSTANSLRPPASSARQDSPWGAQDGVKMGRGRFPRRRSGSRRPDRCGSGCGLPGSGLDLAPQVGDVDAQHLGVVLKARPPDVAQQRPVGEQAPAVAHQVAQEVVLGRRQVDLLAVAAARAGPRGRSAARRPRPPARRRPASPGAAPPAAARPARRGRTAWSRSRRRPRPAPAPSRARRRRPRARGSASCSTRGSSGRPPPRRRRAARGR